MIGVSHLHTFPFPDRPVEKRLSGEETAARPVVSEYAFSILTPPDMTECTTCRANSLDHLHRVTRPWMQRKARGATTYSAYNSPFASTLRLLEGQTVVVEGVPAVGKSTLVFSLQQAIRGAGGLVRSVQEERDDALLNEFFKDPKHNAFWFQMFKLAKRQLIAACTGNVYERPVLPARPGEEKPSGVESSGGHVDPQRVTTLIDRSLPGDMAFAFYQYAVGNISEEQLNIYMAEASRVAWKSPALIIYLTATPEVLVERVKRRGHSSEIAAYDESYFRLMDVCYRRALELCGCDYSIVDWSTNRQAASGPAEALGSASVCSSCSLAVLRDATSTSYTRPGSPPATTVSATEPLVICACGMHGLRMVD